MKRFKVLHLVEDLNIGGLENILKKIVLGLNKDQFDVTVWCLSGGGKVADELRLKKVRIEILNINNFYNPFKLFLLCRKIRSGNFDIIHTHGYFANTAGRISAIVAFIPVIVSHIHSIYWIKKRRHIFFDRVLSHITDRIICISEIVKEFLVNNERIKESKLVRIYNGGSSLSEISNNPLSVKEEFGIAGNPVIIGTVASLNRHKGHNYIIDAVLTICKKGVNILLIIVGDGPLRGELSDYVTKVQGTSNIIFTGEREDILRLISAMDLFVLYSTEKEGLGLALIEAMAMAKPIIASEIGGIPEVVKHGVTGELVRPKDCKMLIQAMTRLISSKELMKAYGEAGKKRFNELFQEKDMVNKVEEVYREELLKKGLIR